MNAPSQSSLAQRLAELPPKQRELLKERIRQSDTSSARTIPLRAGKSAPLSFAQERLWFLEQIENGSVHPNDAMLLRFEGAFDHATFDASVQEIIKRHEILRTRFETDSNGLPTQTTLGYETLQIPIVAVDLPDPADAQEFVLRELEKDLEQPLDLATPPQMRLTIYRQSPELHFAAITIHHIISDLWSFGIVIRELTALYAAFAQGKPSPLPALTVQYGDYAAWQRAQMAGSKLEEDLSYWKHNLEGAPAVLDIAHLDTNRPPQRFQGASSHFTVNADVTKRIKKWSHQSGFTLAMTLLALYKAVLSKHANETDVVVGMPVATRSPQLEGLLGCFLNMVVLRTDLSDNPSLSDAVQRVKDAYLNASDHQDLPFERLVAEIQPQRSRLHHPVFQVAFALQNTPLEPFSVSGLTMTHIQPPSGRSRLDLTLRVTEVNGELDCELEYDVDIFEPGKIAQLAKHLQHTFEAAAADPSTDIQNMARLPEDERFMVLQAWNDTSVEWDSELLIHRIFEERCAVTPNEIAVISEGGSITYAELNAKANQLGRFLRHLGVRPEVPVGVCMRRSISEVTAILAILKAGGYYVPVNPDDSSDRCDEVLDDVQAVIVLADTNIVDDIFAPGRRIVDVEAESDTIAQFDTHNLDNLSLPDNLAYVLFTSGSTGQPKGVAVHHRGFCNRILWGQRNHALAPGDRVLRKAPCVFDVSLDELFRALFTGATSVLAKPAAHFDPNELLAEINKYGVTDLDFSPPALQIFLDTLGDGKCPSLQRVVSGVATLPPATMAAFHETIGTRLDNLYGPTEVSVSCTAWKCTPDDMPARVPIGRPMSNVRIYVLDKYGEPAPVGVPGEIYVGGAGVARGYHGRPDLTAERFVPDPFSSGGGERLYRTGDIGKFTSSGDLIFLGRSDNQINMRGHRIEPAELEARLTEHPDVEAAIVLLKTRADKDTCLCAYIVATDGSDPSPATLRAHMRQRLPEYMVPSAYVSIDALPLTRTGKIDHASLPDPDPSLARHNTRTIAPRNETEATLAQIWGDVLGCRTVGISDDFFDIGGDSILAIRVMKLACDQFDIEVEIAALFDFPTIEELAPYFEAAK